MQAARLAVRLQRELTMFQRDPPPRVCIWSSEDSLTHFEAQMQGPEGTVYATGVFKLDINVPERYPFEPPNIRFKTPIYHPNIDSGGRICLDILTMPPKGAWRPSLNISTLLSSIGLLLTEPNPDDGLMIDITDEYKHNRSNFDLKAKRWTDLYARQIESDSELPKTDANPCLRNVEDSRINHWAEVCSKFPMDVDHVAGARFGFPEKENTSMASTSLSEKLASASNCAINSQLIHKGKRPLSSLKLSLEKLTKSEEGKNISLHQSATSTLPIQQLDEKNIDSAGDIAMKLNQSGSNQFLVSESSDFLTDKTSTVLNNALKLPFLPSDGIEINCLTDVDVCNKLWTRKKHQGSGHQKAKLPLVESVVVGSKSQGGPISDSAKFQNPVEVANIPSRLADHGADTTILVESAVTSAPALPTCISGKSKVSGKYKTLQLSRVKDTKKNFEIISYSNSNKKVAQSDTSSSIINEGPSSIAECVVVSDSESEDEPSNRRCRLSLNQIGLAKKKRAGFR